MGKGFRTDSEPILDLGPLLWHWENSGADTSIELDLEQVKALAEEVGFEIRVRRSVPPTRRGDSLLTI